MKESTDCHKLRHRAGTQELRCAYSNAWGTQCTGEYELIQIRGRISLD